MTRLRSEIPHGLPHEEFVRRKRAARRLDRGLGLLRPVPWPRWIGPVLLVAPFPVAAGLAFVGTGDPAALVLAPAALAVVLGIATVVVVLGDLLRPRRRSDPTIDVDPIDGPRPLLVLLVAAFVVVVVFLLALASGSGLAGAAITTAVPVILVPACAGIGIEVTRVRARLRRGR